jgi:hypothetical protein
MGRAKGEKTMTGSHREYVEFFAVDNARRIAKTHGKTWTAYLAYLDENLAWALDGQCLAALALAKVGE